jgi:hypothetical protein
MKGQAALMSKANAQAARTSTGLLRFTQLLCEGHNNEAQEFLRDQTVALERFRNMPGAGAGSASDGKASSSAAGAASAAALAVRSGTAAVAVPVVNLVRETADFALQVSAEIVTNHVVYDAAVRAAMVQGHRPRLQVAWQGLEAATLGPLGVTVRLAAQAFGTLTEMVQVRVRSDAKAVVRKQ